MMRHAAAAAAAAAAAQAPAPVTSAPTLPTVASTPRRVATAPAKPASKRHGTARWSRRRGVTTAFAGIAALGFAAAYIGPLGAAFTPHAEAAVTPVTLYTSTIRDAQTFVAADGAGQAADLQRDTYTVYVPPKPKPSPNAQAAAAWKAPFVVPNPGSAQAIAYDMVKARGWGDDQFACLVALWNRESGWRVNAYNSSGAYGIPQALPGSKMGAYGADWQTNPATQIQWGLGYISGRYGTPCGAWGHSQSTGWY
ncbi:lytic transglycosylase domain-containing protein [Microbacterium candidum]|uniref:Lytic transglycosylase domain-containing protein n=1 Tax=Microbacterium candidum TaxID=3041922 RepID=A0ABT7MZV3_9MICO|nr:lytic transglycosylase domain-containing protein [Microbacterium sp. ASV49]MDL9979951.1 lytic transglycosylase domain-containing protein [Microbacterium sp. ASV49]